MPPSRLLLRVAATLFVTACAHILAIDVQVATVRHPIGTGVETVREYILTTSGTTDNRFEFKATESHRRGDFRWHLDVRPGNMEHWAPGITFDEYTEVLYRCVDRFIADIPSAKVDGIDFYFTDDSEVWKGIKAKLISMMKDNSGFAVGYPEEKTAWLSANCASASPVMAQIERKLAERLNRKFTKVWPKSDGALLERNTPEDYKRTWADVLRLPHLGIKMDSISVTLGFE